LWERAARNLSGRRSRRPDR